MGPGKNSRQRHSGERDFLPECAGQEEDKDNFYKFRGLKGQTCHGKGDLRAVSDFAVEEDNAQHDYARGSVHPGQLFQEMNPGQHPGNEQRCCQGQQHNDILLYSLPKGNP